MVVPDYTAAGSVVHRIVVHSHLHTAIVEIHGFAVRSLDLYKPSVDSGHPILRARGEEVEVGLVAVVHCIDLLHNFAVVGRRIRPVADFGPGLGCGGLSHRRVY